MSLENWVCVLERSVFRFDYEFRPHSHFIYTAVVLGLDKLEELVQKLLYLKLVPYLWGTK